MSQPIINTTKDRKRIEAMARVFKKTDRVLSGNPIEVTVEDAPGIQAPSWTDGKTITFNKGLIGNVTTIEDIIRLSGLNYHELAHVLYTPRSGSKIVKSIQAGNLHNAFNLLEDQRIETFLTSIYPSTIPYLVSTFMRFCIQSDSAWQSNFVLMHGRRYLPADVRNEFRKRFIRQDLIPAFEAIIDEYRKLVYPADGDRGVELALEFDNLLQQLHANVQDPHGHTSGGRTEITCGRPAPTADQRDASESVDDADKELEERDKEREQASQANDDSKSDEDRDDESGSGNSEFDDDFEDSDDDEDEFDDDESGNQGNAGTGDISKSDSSNDSDSGVTSGVGNGSDGPNTDSFSDNDLRDFLEQVAKEYEQSDEVIEDAIDKQRAIVQDHDGIGSSLDGRRFQEHPVYPNEVALVRKFATVLERLSSDSDPGWQSHSSSGRINVRRVMEGAEYDELWDRWEDGNNDATDIECVIAVDTSGSMTYQMDQASRALWVIKRALETLDANVTVITYGADSHVVYQRGERASRTNYKRLSAAGTTAARPAVFEAASILEASNRHNKIFISITDGLWNTESSSHKTSDEIIAALNGIGVTTALAYIGHNFGVTHNCAIVGSVDSPLGLIEFAQKIVKKTITPRKVA